MEYKKEGNIGNALYMESKDGGSYNAGIVSDIKDGKVIVLDADGKKHQYSVNNKKIIGYWEAVKDKPSSMADIAPKSPVIFPASSEEKINEEEITTNPETKLEVFTGIVNTIKYSLNVRAGAGKQFRVIKTLPKGSKIELYTEKVDGWYKLADGSGYVDANLIRGG